MIRAIASMVGAIPPEEEELGGLPPIDGDSAEEPPPAIQSDEEVEPAPVRDGEDPFDDSTPASDGDSSDLQAEEASGLRGRGRPGASPEERGWLEEPAENPALDIGAFDLVGATVAEVGSPRGAESRASEEAELPSDA